MFANINKFLSACDSGDKKFIEKLIELGFDVKQCNYGCNGFHSACTQTSSQCLMKHLAEKTKPNQK